MGWFLYSWQFPHFHALSWNLRHDYTKAGYQMMAAIYPRSCTSSSFNHTLELLLICSYFAPAFDLTEWTFSLVSMPFNLVFIYLAAKFKRDKDAKSSRLLFRYSLIYLPIMILLLFLNKKPVNERVNYIDKVLHSDNSFNFEDFFRI